jgi:hypothetical protein
VAEEADPLRQIALGGGARCVPVALDRGREADVDALVEDAHLVRGEDHALVRADRADRLADRTEASGEQVRRLSAALPLRPFLDGGRAGLAATRGSLTLGMTAERLPDLVEEVRYLAERFLVRHLRSDLVQDDLDPRQDLVPVMGDELVELRGCVHRGLHRR